MEHLFLDLIAPRPPVPFAHCLAALLRARFDPVAARPELERLLDEDPSLRPYVRLDGLRDGGYLVDDSILFPGPPSQWLLRAEAAPYTEDLVAHFLFEPGRLRQAAILLRKLTAATVGVPWDRLEEMLGPALSQRCLQRPASVTWPAITAPGIYRREHASLLIRSRTTSVLVDPIGMHSIGPCPWDPQLHPGHVDAIVITHGHGDHWHLPSLVHHADRTRTQVFVPDVPRTSLLTPTDFVATLHQLGLRAQALPWWSTARVGDVEIDALPFYGEQPVCEGPGLAEGLRSWGNCYRITTPEFSVLLLVDSGRDPAGSMVEVAARSRAERGPVDVTMACLRSFSSPFFGGLSNEFAALPFARLQALFAQYTAGLLPPTTAGPEGTALLCAALESRHFLPYAHGHEGLGREVQDIGWGTGEASEHGACADLAAALRRLGAPTEIGAWNPGDVAHLDRGQLLLEPWRP